MAQRIGYMVEIDPEIARQRPDLLGKTMVIDEGKVTILPGKLYCIDLDTNQLIPPEKAP